MKKIKKNEKWPNGKNDKEFFPKKMKNESNGEHNDNYNYNFLLQ